MRHVLLGNDDGIFAPGLRALADAFIGGGWRVTVVAPDRERSAAAHSITIKRPVVARKVTWEGVPEGAPLTLYALDGTPADCAKIGIHALCDGKPDLVVSGVNNGWNVGTDVHYSGTVGVAMEAAFEGVLGIAISAKWPDAARYRYAAELALKVANEVVGNDSVPMPSVINLNIPDRDPAQIKALVEAPMTRIRYTDAYDVLDRSERQAAYWLKGEIIEESFMPEGDLAMLVEGYATVTLLGWDITQPGICKDFLQDLQ